MLMLFLLFFLHIVARFIMCVIVRLASHCTIQFSTLSPKTGGQFAKIGLWLKDYLDLIATVSAYWHCLLLTDDQVQVDKNNHTYISSSVFIGHSPVDRSCTCFLTFDSSLNEVVHAQEARG